MNTYSKWKLNFAIILINKILFQHAVSGHFDLYLFFLFTFSMQRENKIGQRNISDYLNVPSKYFPKQSQNFMEDVHATDYLMSLLRNELIPYIIIFQLMFTY